MSADRSENSRWPGQSRALSLAGLVVFVLLLTVHLGRREFWLDESITVGHVTSLANTADVYHPRGYYVLLYGWTRLFGAGDLSLRLFSVPWGLAAYLLLGLIGRRVAGEREALVAQWLLALSPFALLYFRMARYFAMSAGIGAMVVAAAVLAAQEGRWRHWASLAVAAILALTTDYLLAGLLAPLFLWLAWVARSRRQGARWLACALPCLVVALVPGRAVLMGAHVVHGGEVTRETLTPAGLVLRLVLPLYSLAVGETTFPWRLAVTLPAMAAVVLGLLLGLALRQGRPGYALVRWAWPLAVVETALVLALLARLEPVSAAARSTLFSVPVAYLLVAAGLCRLKSRPLCLLATAVILAADGYGVANYFAGRQFLNPGYAVPWRQVARFIEQSQRPGDQVAAFYDGTVCQYGHLARFTNEIPQYEPEKLRALQQWPAGGGRLWLLCRDRGSPEASRDQTDTLALLTPRAARVQVFPFMPVDETERHYRRRLLHREVEDAYLKVYLLTPPGSARGR